MRITKRGTLQGYLGTWLSALGYLLIDGEPIPCLSTPTIEALERAYGSVIGPDYTVRQEGIIGREVIYQVAEIEVRGVAVYGLVGFTPAEEWVGADVPPEGLQEP